MYRDPINGPVCLNHTDRLAVAHCCVCRRPVCRECLVEGDGFKCCSQECLEKARVSTIQAEIVDRNRQRVEAKQAKSKTVKWIILVIVLVLLFVFRGAIMGFYHNSIKPIFKKKQQTIQQTVQDFNQKNIQKDKIRRNKKMNDLERQGL